MSPKRTDLRSILIVGSGPIRIGQGCEFDYAGVQACRALRAAGYRVVLANSNPATFADDWRLYALDLGSAEARLVTPGEGVHAMILGHNRWNRTTMLVGLNADDPAQVVVGIAGTVGGRGRPPADGSWGETPGGDLLAYTYGNCPAGPDSAQRLGLLALSLKDGAPTVVISPGPFSKRPPFRRAKCWMQWNPIQA